MEDLYRKHEDRSRGGKSIRDSVYIRISFAQQNLSQAVYEIVHAQARHGIGGVNESAEEVTQVYACGQVTRGSTARDKSIHYERTKGKVAAGFLSLNRRRSCKGQSNKRKSAMLMARQ